MDNEFGLVLERPESPDDAPAKRSAAFIRRWATCVLDARARDPRRLVTLQAALLANLGSVDELWSSALVLSEIMGDETVRSREVEAANEDKLAAATEPPRHSPADSTGPTKGWPRSRRVGPIGPVVS